MDPTDVGAGGGIGGVVGALLTYLGFKDRLNRKVDKDVFKAFQGEVNRRFDEVRGDIKDVQETQKDILETVNFIKGRVCK